MLIHQIWIGKNVRPDIWMDTIKTFCKQYDHTYILWDEKKIENELTQEAVLFEGVAELIKSVDDYAGLADIYRLLILNKHGGVYIDSDIVVINGEVFNKLIESKKDHLYFAYEDEERNLIANSVIGSPKDDPFIRYCLEHIHRNAESTKNEAMWIRTGPLFISKMYEQNKHEQGFAVEILPSKLFYPISWHGIKEIDHHKQFLHSFEYSMLFQYGYSTNGLKDKIAIDACVKSKRKLQKIIYFILSFLLFIILVVAFFFGKTKKGRSHS